MSLFSMKGSVILGNDLTFTQVAQIIAEIASQATGEKILAPLDLTNFVNVGQLALKNGYDPVFRAISQVLSWTIFSVRPYYRKFQGMETTAATWGNHVRKISYVDTKPEDNDTYKYPACWDDTQNPASGNGQSVDQWIIKKADFIQTNFYGANTFGDHLSIFRKPMEVAFQSPSEFSYWLNGLITNWTSQREQWIEGMARATLANLIASVAAEGTASRHVHLITAYNAQTGKSLDYQTVFAPENYVPFVQWVFSEIDRISGMMTERSELFQTQITGKTVNRHTPYANQRVFIYRPYLTQVSTMALSDIYHTNFLRMAVTEEVNFWQSILSPSAINMTPTYMGADGTLVTPDAPVALQNVFGVICDQEACGYAITDNSSLATPLNARAEYSNIWWKSVFKNYNDLTEKVVILTMD